METSICNRNCNYLSYRMGITKPLSRRFNTGSITADTDVFSEDFQIDSGRSAARITISLGSDAVVYLTETVNGTTKRYSLNGGAVISSGSLYSFDVPIRGDGSYNLQLGTSASIALVNVDEVEEGTV